MREGVGVRGREGGVSSVQTGEGLGGREEAGAKDRLTPTASTAAGATGERSVTKTTSGRQEGEKRETRMLRVGRQSTLGSGRAKEKRHTAQW